MKAFLAHCYENDLSWATVLEQQAGWASSVVIHNGAVNDNHFLRWRPASGLNRHTKLKWLPDCLFFQDDSDAMNYFLSLGEQHATDE